MNCNKSVKDTSIQDKLCVYGEPNEEDYEILKSGYLKGEFPKDRIFVYTVKACDNLIDRDLEVFSHNALIDIASLMSSKPGLEDHNWSTSGQNARVYKTQLVKDSNRKNEFGDDYEYVIAYCYMVNNDTNKSLIENILAGIKKEVSVGCSSDKCICTICGAELTSENPCVHKKGRMYNKGGKESTCVYIIDGVDDFYELSFVSVPAQREAGIMKNKRGEKKQMEAKKVKSLEIEEALSILKSAVENGEKKIGKETSEILKSIVEENEKLSKELSKFKMNSIRAKVIGSKKFRSKSAEELFDTVMESLMGDGTAATEEMYEEAVSKYEEILFEGDEQEDGDEPAEKNLEDGEPDSISENDDEIMNKGKSKGFTGRDKISSAIKSNTVHFTIDDLKL